MCATQQQQQQQQHSGRPVSVRRRIAPMPDDGRARDLFGEYLRLNKVRCSVSCVQAVCAGMASDDAEFEAAIAMSLADGNAQAAPADIVEAKLPTGPNARAAPAHVQDFAIKHIRWGSHFCPILLQASRCWHRAQDRTPNALPFSAELERSLPASSDSECAPAAQLHPHSRVGRAHIYR